MKILLAVDGSSFSAAAAAEVASRPWPPSSEVKVVTAYQVPMTTTPEVWATSDEYYPALEKIAREQAQAIVDATLPSLGGGFETSLRITGEVLTGPACEAILEKADAWQADLIVMGSHGYGAWRRLFLGSVSQAVVSHAKCSVEIVHQRQESDGIRAA